MVLILKEKGDIDLTNSNINFNMNLIFFKDYANIVGAIPVLNYIILGDRNKSRNKNKYQW